MLKHIAKAAPTSFLLKILPLYVSINNLMGTNTIEYTISGKNIQYMYKNKEQYMMLFNMVEDNRIVAEDITLDYFQELTNCDSFVDVGAYHGLYTLIIGKIFDDVELICFEPNEKNRQILEQTLNINDIYAEIRGEIISNKSGEMEFYEWNNGSSQGHSTTPDKNANKVVKKSVSLSKFFKEKGIKRPYVKLDAEGEEYNILQDVCDMKNMHSVQGIVEIHPDKMNENEDDIVDLFHRNEFDWERIGDTTGPDFSPRPAYYFSRKF